jgi:hypothetical protein
VNNALTATCTSAADGYCAVYSVTVSWELLGALVDGGFFLLFSAMFFWLLVASVRLLLAWLSP